MNARHLLDLGEFKNVGIVTCQCGIRWVTEDIDTRPTISRPDGVVIPNGVNTFTCVCQLRLVIPSRQQVVIGVPR